MAICAWPYTPRHISLRVARGAVLFICEPSFSGFDKLFPILHMDLGSEHANIKDQLEKEAIKFNKEKNIQGFGFGPKFEMTAGDRFAKARYTALHLTSQPKKMIFGTAAALTATADYDTEFLNSGFMDQKVSATWVLRPRRDSLKITVARLRWAITALRKN
jgi:hypothetical protein